MSVVAAVASGVFVAVTVGLAVGAIPQRAVRSRERGRVAAAAARRWQAQQAWLSQAGVPGSPLRFAAVTVTAATVTFAGLVELTQAPVVAAGPAVAAGALPGVVAARRRATRLDAIRRAWPDALRDLGAAVSAGRSLTQALHDLAERGPEPLRAAFARFPTLARVLGVSAALEVVREDLADPTTDRVVEVLIVAHEQGGGIVTALLRDLADATTRDLQIAEEVATNALEQRLNARAVFVLPWLVLLVLVARPGHFRDFYQSSAGLLVVGVATLLSAAGLALTSRLARQPMEPRVLAADDQPR